MNLDPFFSVQNFSTHNFTVFTNRISILPDFYSAKFQHEKINQRIFNIKDIFYCSNGEKSVEVLFKRVVSEFRAHNLLALLDLHLLLHHDMKPDELSVSEAKSIFKMKEGPWNGALKAHFLITELFTLHCTPPDMIRFFGLKEYLNTMVPNAVVKEALLMGDMILQMNTFGSSHLESALRICDNFSENIFKELFADYTVSEWKRVIFKEKKGHFVSKADLGPFFAHPLLKKYLPNPLPDVVPLYHIKKTQSEALYDFFVEKKEQDEKIKGLLQSIPPYWFDLFRDKLEKEIGKTVTRHEDLFIKSAIIADIDLIKEKLDESLISYKNCKRTFVESLKLIVQNVRVVLKNKLKFRVIYAVVSRACPHVRPQLSQVLYSIVHEEEATNSKERMKDSKEPFSLYDLHFCNALAKQPQQDLKLDLDDPFSVMENALFAVLYGKRIEKNVLIEMKKLIEENHLLFHEALLLYLYHENDLPAICNAMSFFERDPNLLYSLLLNIELHIAEFSLEEQALYTKTISPLIAGWDNKKDADEMMDGMLGEAKPLFYYHYFVRMESWEKAYRAAKLLLLFDDAQTVDDLGKILIKKGVYPLAFSIFASLTELFRKGKHPLFVALFHAFGKGTLRNYEKAEKFYREALQLGEESALWLLFHLKFCLNHPLEITIPHDIMTIDRTVAFQALSLFDPNWNESALIKRVDKHRPLSPKEQWEEQMVLLDQELAAIDAPEDMIAGAREEIVKNFSQKKEIMQALLQKVSEYKRGLECEKLLIALKGIYEGVLVQFEKERQCKETKATNIYKGAVKKVSALREDFGAIQKEMEESFSWLKPAQSKDQEVVQLKRQLKVLEQKNRELEKTLAIKEAELQEEKEMEQNEKQWNQEIALTNSPQNINERAKAKIQRILELGKETKKIEKHFWNIIDNPMPPKKEMLSLLNELGFTQRGVRGSHVHFTKKMATGSIFCLFWNHENTLTQQEKKACLERVLLVLDTI